MSMSRKIAEKIVDFFFDKKEEVVVEKMIMKKEEPLIGKRLAALRDKMWFLNNYGMSEYVFVSYGYMFFSFDTIYGKRLVVVRHHDNLFSLNNSNRIYRFLMYCKVTDDKPLWDLARAFPGANFFSYVEKLFTIDVDRHNVVEINTYNECKYITKKEMDLALLEVENKIDELYNKYKQLYEESQRKYEALQEYRCKLEQQFQTEY